MTRTQQFTEGGQKVVSDKVHLSAGNWLSLIGLIYVPVIAAAGWAINVDTRLSVQQEQFRNLKESILEITTKYDKLDERIRNVERKQ